MPNRGSNDPKSHISELKVSGHTMSLEPGLYCVFSAPDGPAPNNETGLPVVRISAAPGRSTNQVEVVGLNPHGWIGPEAATLVRVSQGLSELLVTVYQARDTTSDAPRLQVVRISGPVQASQAQVASGSAGQDHRGAAPETMEIVAHIYGRGDVGAHVGDWTGEPGSKRWIEGFGISAAKGVPASDIEYQAVLGRGWLSPWSEGGQFCGSRGMSLPILGLRVRLRGASADTHRITLSATFIDGARVGPVRDGDACEAPSLAALEAFRVSIEAIGAKVRPAPAAIGPMVKPRAARAGRHSPAPIEAKSRAKPVAAKSVTTRAATPTRAVKNTATGKKIVGKSDAKTTGLSPRATDPSPSAMRTGGVAQQARTPKPASPRRR